MDISVTKFMFSIFNFCLIYFFFLKYLHRYLRWVRACHSEVSDDTGTCSYQFVTATVWAEMRKTVSYKVDIKVDKHGVIVESQVRQKFCKSTH